MTKKVQIEENLESRLKNLTVTVTKIPEIQPGGIFDGQFEGP